MFQKNEGAFKNYGAPKSGILKVHNFSFGCHWHIFCLTWKQNKNSFKYEFAYWQTSAKAKPKAKQSQSKPKAWAEVVYTIVSCALPSHALPSPPVPTELI